ncbi:MULTISPECIES: acyltransferase [unclassified Streptomyces]|uniref:acyltransferase n=1 Tax=unclassified Streptomyces TaxID=2593676 RepID=UPI0037F1E873
MSTISVQPTITAPATATGPVTAAETASAEVPPAKPVREHRYDIDLLRVLCSIGVIVCHAAGQFLNVVGRHPSGGAPVYWVALVGHGLSRCAVPLFFAMAGWVVLSGAPPRSEAQVRTRLVRILVPMAVWTAIYLLWGWAQDTNPHSTKRLAYESLFGSVAPTLHLWYLYAYVPVILVLSMTSLVKDGKRPWGLAVVFLALALTPAFLDDAAGVLNIDIPEFTWVPLPYQIAYAAVGAFLLALPASATTGRGRRTLWLGASVCAWAAVVLYEHFVRNPAPYDGFMMPILAGTLLMAFNRLTVPKRFRPLLSKLGTAAFGAYLVHLLFLKLLARHLVTPDAGWLGALGLMTVLVGVTAVLSFAVSMLWTRLHLSRWLG